MPNCGWNSTLGNHQPNHSQPAMCYPLSCRLCNKTFVTTQGVVTHYQAHVNEIISRRNPNNLRQHDTSPTLGLPMSPPLSFFHNGPQISNPNFFGASSSPQMFPSMFSAQIVNHGNPSRHMPSPSPSTIYRNKRKFDAQFHHQAMRYNYILGQHVPVQPSQANKRFRGRDESCSQTQWYLDQLDSSPRIIYLEDDDELNCVDLDLSLKL